MAQIKKAKNTYRVYALCHPTSGRVYYVGQTRLTLEERLKAHIYSPSSVKLKSRMAKFKTKGQTPSIKLLEGNISYKEINKREQYWIAKLNGWGNCNTVSKTFHIIKTAPKKRAVLKSIL